MFSNINKVVALDVAHEDKVRWDIDGDQTTKFFHGVLKKNIDS